MAESRIKQFARFGLPGGPGRGNPLRAAVLEFNKRLRNGDGSAGKHDFGHVVLQIPELDFYILRERFPDLAAPDGETRLRAWKKFLRDPLSEIYRVR